MGSYRTALAVAFAAALTMAAPPAGTAQTTTGVTADTIKIGNINPYSGPASAYGQIGKTIEAYVNMINEKGGIHGRKIEFISYDDGYSPPKTVEQARRLVESDEVLLIFQSLGTPTNSAIHKYMNAKKVPQLFVATGASKWGDPQNFPWTIGFNPDYRSEARIYANYILTTYPDARIAVLYQNDDYGKDYLEGLRAGFGDKAETMIVAEAPYETSDPTVDSQMINLKSSGADLFINITTPKFAAQAIKKKAELGWDAVHFLNNVSVSVGSVLKPAGFEASKGIISAAYLKEPDDPQWADDKGIAEWRAFMDKYYPDGDQTSSFTTYGYAAGQLLEHVLTAAGPDISRESVMQAATGLKDLELSMLLPGIVVNTGPEDYYPVQSMQLMRFNGESWERFGEVISASGS